MKHYFFILVLALLLSACVNNSSSQTEMATASTEDVNSESAESSNYVLANIVDSIISANPDYLNNDIKRKKVAKEIQTAFISAVNNNHDVLTEIPLTFEQMMQKGNKYIVKFELANVGSNGTRISNKYDIYFNVFTEMSEEEASDLIQKHKYHLTFNSFSDVSGKLVLPSGRTFTDTPNVYMSSLDDRTSVSPGGFLVTGVKFTE